MMSREPGTDSELPSLRLNTDVLSSLAPPTVNGVLSTSVNSPPEAITVPSSKVTSYIPSP